MKIKIVDNKFEVVSEKSFEVQEFDLENVEVSHLLHLYNRFVRCRFRVGTAKTKGRSEISCSGRKPYKQKGTGNARRGRNSSPLRRGGAVAFGPQPRSYAFKMNKKLISKLKQQVFSMVAKKINIISSNSVFSKTKDAQQFLSNIKASKVLFLCSSEDYNLVKAFQNISNIIIDDIRYVEPELMMTQDSILISESAFQMIVEEKA
jgi:large subunit ribosomal protein L4